VEHTAHGEEKLHLSGNPPEVMVAKAAENRSRPDGAAGLREMPRRNVLVDALMRTFGIVVVDVFGENSFNLTFGDENKVIERFAAD